LRVVKLSRRLHVLWYPSVNTFKFQSCNHTPPGPEALRFPSGCKSRDLPPRWYHLRREIKRFLIIVYPRTFALDQQVNGSQLPSLLSVLGGSSYFTCPHQIRPTPRYLIVHAHCWARPFFAGLYNSYLALSTPIFSKWPANGYELFNCSNVRESYQ